jgi:hypothetical protein
MKSFVFCVKIEQGTVIQCGEKIAVIAMNVSSRSGMTRSAPAVSSGSSSQ